MRGGVYPYETSDGRRWRAVFDGPPDPATGQRRQTGRRGFETRREAEAFLREALAKVETGTWAQASRLTLREYLDSWLLTLRVKPTTLSDYRQSVERYVDPRIGGLRLTGLSPEHIDGLYRELERHGKRAGPCTVAGITCREHGCIPDEHDGLSPKSVRLVHGMLHKALNDGVERGLIPRNPASLAHPPTAKQVRSSNPREHVWDQEQLATFLEHAADDRLHALWRLALTTAGRRGELLGLRWADVDLGRNTVRFGAQTLTTVRGTLVWQHEGKTDAATRTLAVDLGTTSVLRGHHGRQEAQKAAAGGAWRGDPHGPLVFTTSVGTAIRPSALYHRLQVISRQAGLPRIDIHGLRHSYATAALRAGVSPEVLAQRLGHADVSITLSLYAHVRPRDDHGAATQVAHYITRGR